MTYTIRVCSGFMCKQNFSDDLFKEFKKAVGENENITIEKSGCFAQCDKGPNIQVINEETGERTIYNNPDVKEVLQKIDSKADSK